MEMTYSNGDNHGSGGNGSNGDDPGGWRRFVKPVVVALIGVGVVALVWHFANDTAGVKRSEAPQVTDRFKVRLDGEYVRNLAYNANRAFNSPSTPVNNFNNASSSGTVTQSDYQSGPTGYMFKATVGEPDTVEAGQWNFSVTYKYLEPDAVLDAFTDPDFDLGGTNAKGYILGVQYAVAKNAWLQARYLSAREVYGPPLSIDVLQLEMNARF